MILQPGDSWMYTYHRAPLRENPYGLFHPQESHPRSPAKSLQAAALDLVPRLEDEVLNGHDGTGGATALHYAAAAGYADLCWELLESPHFFVLNEQDCQVWRFQLPFFFFFFCCCCCCCWMGFLSKRWRYFCFLFKDVFFVRVKLAWIMDHFCWCWQKMGCFSSTSFFGCVKWKKGIQTNKLLCGEQMDRGFCVHIFCWGGGEVKKTCIAFEN